MTAVTGTHPLIPDLLAAVGAPKNVKSLVLRFSATEVATVEVEYFLESGQLEKLVQVLTLPQPDVVVG